MPVTLASIPSPSANGLHLGPLFVHAYGLMYVIALVAAVALTRRLWEARGGDRALVDEVALWGFPAGLIGGRLYHDLTSWNEVPHTWWGPFAIWKGGLGIWGGIALGTLAGLVVLRRRRADIPAFLDAAAAGLLVAQAIGRIGNYFNQELFGGPTSLPWGLRIDPAHRPAGYEQYATFHPTFLYELVWDLALAAVIVWLWRRRAVRPPGLFALYVTGYSLARIGEELLRVDPAHHFFGLRLNFFVAATLTIAGLLWFARTQWPRRARAVRRGGALLVGLGALVVTGCGHERDRRPAASADRPSAQCAWPWACGTAAAGTRTASIAARAVVTGTQSRSASVPTSVAAIGSASCWPLTASASGVCVAWSASRNGNVAPT
jgi:prolipoprotein diacylglyceryl transferase